MLCSNWKITCFQCFQFQFHSRHLCDPTGFRHLSNGMPLTNLWRCGGIVLYHWVVSSRVQSSPEKGSLSWWQWHGRKMWSESVHTYARGCACLHRLLLRSAFKDRRSFQLPAFNQIWICCVVSHQWVISLIVIVWFWLIRFVIYIPSSLFMWVWCGVQCGCVCGVDSMILDIKIINPPKMDGFHTKHDLFCGSLALVIGTIILSHCHIHALNPYPHWGEYTSHSLPMISPPLVHQVLSGVSAHFCCWHLLFPDEQHHWAVSALIQNCGPWR